jgi:hypothetical protein
LNTLRLINLLTIAGIMYLLSRIHPMAGLIFITFPMVNLIGVRFYSEIPVMLCVTIALWAMHKEKPVFFALALSYAAIVRIELVLLFIPAALWLWKEKRRHIIPLLCFFPFIYYLMSVVVLGGWDSLIGIYTKFAGQLGWKSPDPLHYVKGLISMCGLWIFIAVRNNIARQDKVTRFSQAGLVLLVIFYALSYWDKTAFGPIIGIERHLLTTAPFVAVLAARAFTKWHWGIYVISVSIILLWGPLPADREEPALLLSIERMAPQIARTDIYTDSAIGRYRLIETGIDVRIHPLKDWSQGRDNDLIFWDNHYGVRVITPQQLQKVSLLELVRDNGFIAAWLTVGQMKGK